MGTFEPPSDIVLAHFGVKGMKWGVRKDRETKTPSARKQRYDTIRNSSAKSYQFVSKNGKTVDVIQDRNGRISSFMSSLSKTGVEDAAISKSFQMHVDGKHVGEASFKKGGRSDDDPTDLNLTWLGVKKSERGKGYASAVFDAAVQYGQAEGYKKLSLEVPGKAKDARHIYEKRGFVVTWEPTPQQARGDRLGGLIDMELDLTKNKLKHSDISKDEIDFERALIATFTQLDVGQEAQVFDGEARDNDIGPSDVVLAHYGIKGMKWGVRRRSDSNSRPSSRRTTYKKEDLSKLSNADIQARINRLNLEKQYSQLNGEAANSTRSKGKQIAKKVLAEAGTATAKNALQQLGQFGVKVGAQVGVQYVRAQLKKQ